MPPAIVPTDLHFSQLASQIDGIDQFSDRFAIVGPDDFDFGSAADFYDQVNFSGVSNITYGLGACVFEPGALGQAGLQSKTQPMAPYCWAEATIDSWADGVAATVGFVKNATNFLRWDVHFTGTPYPNKVGLHGQINGTSINGAFQPTNPIALAPVLPFKLRCVVAWPDWWGWIEDANGNRAVMRGQMSSPDLRLLTHFAAGWRPFFGALRFNPTTAGLTASQFRTGYTGGIMVRDFKPVTLADGEPYVDPARPAKRFFSTTCATGHGFKTNHLSVMSVDVDSGASRLESLLFFNISSTDRGNPLATKDMRTSLYGGQIVRSPADDKWLLMVNGWGLGDASTGVGLWYADTTTDLTNDAGALALNAHLLTVYSFVPQTLSFYDNSFCWDEAAGKWRVALTKASTPQNWSMYYPALYEGPDLNNLVQVAQDQTFKAEGTCWSRVGGAWYVTAGGVSGPHYWTSNLGYQGNLLPNLDLTGLNVSFNTYGSHFFMMPVDREAGTKTQYVCLLFTHDQLLAAQATKGKLVVMDSNEIVDGTEF